MKLKKWQNIFHVIVNACSIVTKCNSLKKWNNKACHCECKNYHKCKKDYSWNTSTCICDNSKYLKSVADTSVIIRNEIIYVVDIASTKITNIIETNVTKKCHIKKVRDSYILYTVLLAIILLWVITITFGSCYDCAKNRSKHFDDVIKLEHFDLDKILIDEKLHKNDMIYDILYRTFNWFKTFAN